ncbi:MAG: glycosyltransferase family 1 protein [Elusimicrobiota bacterium]
MIAMNVGIDARELTGNMTGIGRMLFNLLTGISLSPSGSGNTFVLFGNNHTCFEYNFLNNKSFKKIIIPEKCTLWWDQVKLKNAMSRSGCDVFFSPYYKMPLFLKIPAVISMFDTTYLITQPYSGKYLYNIYLKNFISTAGKKAKKVLTCSENSKKDLISKLKLSPEKIEVAYLSVNKNIKPASPDEIEKIRSKYKLQGKFILYLGNFSPHKNLSRLADAYKHLPDNIKDEYSLVLAGGNGTTTAGTVAGAGKIVFPGYVQEEDVPSLYSAADLFVFPSLYEGFGLPPLEAMACGCPVVSSNTSSMPEILGDACMYFDPYNTQDIRDRLQQILADNGLRQTVRRKGIERAGLYTPERMTQKILGVLSE